VRLEHRVCMQKHICFAARPLNAGQKHKQLAKFVTVWFKHAHLIVHACIQGHECFAPRPAFAGQRFAPDTLT